MFIYLMYEYFIHYLKKNIYIYMYKRDIKYIY